MLRKLIHIPFMLYLLFVAGPVYGETNLTGRIGMDFTNYQFGSDLKDTIRTYSVNRSKSGHYLDLSLTGPIVNDHFASYTSRVKVSGVYFNAKSENENRNIYISPEFSTIYGMATFLPNKPYPLQLYYTDTKDYNLRFETNNLSEKDRLKPALSIVRRYDYKRNMVGGSWQITPSPNVSIIAEGSHFTSEMMRNYDFDEGQDIWVKMIHSRANPGDSVFSAVFTNNLDENATITIINIDSLSINGNPLVQIIDNLPPTMTETIYLYPGLTEIEIDSRTYNRYTNQVDVHENLIVTIEFNDPAAPLDLDQQMDIMAGQILLGGEGKLMNSTKLEFSEQSDAFQDQLSTRDAVNNNLSYEINPNLQLAILTDYANMSSTVDTNRQENVGLLHQTNVSYSKKGKISANLIHSYNKTESRNSNDTLIGTLNSFSNSITLPFRKYEYKIDIKNNVSLLSDNRDRTDEKYNTAISNSMTTLFKGVKIEPSYKINYGYNTQTNPDKQSNSLESRLEAKGLFPPRSYGTFSIKGEYFYRNNWNKESSNSESKYRFDMMLSKTFSKKLRVVLFSSQEWKTTGRTATSDIGKLDSSLPTEYNTLYRLDFRLKPSDNFLVNGTFSTISQGNTNIKKYGLSFSGEIAKIQLPLKVNFLREERDLSILPKQSNMSIESETNFRVRKITLVLKHSYKKQNQLYETYYLHEIIGELSRNFDLF